jgi:hypothetical protein
LVPAPEHDEPGHQPRGDGQDEHRGRPDVGGGEQPHDEQPRQQAAADDEQEQLLPAGQRSSWWAALGGRSGSGGPQFPVPDRGQLGVALGGLQEPGRAFLGACPARTLPRHADGLDATRQSSG